LYEWLLEDEIEKPVEEEPKKQDDYDVPSSLPQDAQEALVELLADRGPLINGLSSQVHFSKAATAEACNALPPEVEAKRQKRREYRERKRLKKQAGLFIKAKENPNVYVSGLPHDSTADELESIFKRAGVLKVDPNTGSPKIRVYRDENGRCKGDALVTYANSASVELALEFLHDFELRPGNRIAVQQADFDEQERSQPVSMSELKSMVAKQPEDQQRKRKAAQQLQKQATAWDTDIDDGTGRKIVVLRHMFSPQEAASEGPAFYEELAEEVKEECGKLGQVSKVTPFERHKLGIVCVKFKNSAEAEECIRVMDGRFFGGRRVEAAFYDGKTDLRALGQLPAKRSCQPQSFSASEPLAALSTQVLDSSAEQVAVASPSRSVAAADGDHGASSSDVQKAAYDAWLDDQSSGSDDEFQIHCED
jgi:HIV Tat-specific factor 1